MADAFGANLLREIREENLNEVYFRSQLFPQYSLIYPFASYCPLSVLHLVCPSIQLQSPA